MKRAYGFTIIELIIVVVIIGILTAISIVTYNNIQQKSNKTQVLAAIKDISNALASEYLVNESYPNDLSNILNTPDGVKIDRDLKVSYDAWGQNDYCLTVATGSISPVSYYKDGSDIVEGGCSGHRISGNFITNGDERVKDNSGFSNFDFNSNDAPPGSDGSFVSRTGNYTFYCSEQKVPISHDKNYKISIWARQTVPAVTTANTYLGLCPYDADNLLIGPTNYMYRPNTTTTLAQPLNKGDTVVKLTNVSSSWYNLNDANTHNRSFIFWGYKDGKGKTWPPETYSRNGWHSDMWTGGATYVNTANNTITLNKPWPGSDYPAGHPVSNQIPQDKRLVE